jgi:tripartite-type tricarboxylate transporter receptor subunit TctC
MMAQKFQESWGQTVVVDNKPGAGGTIGNNLVAKATPDGYTVLVGITAVIQQPPLMPNLPYDIFKDFVPVTRIAISPSLFAVPPSSPANSIKDFAAIVKANPGKYNYGSYGAGTSSHIQGSLLNLQAGLDMVHVPFAGAAPLVNNMMGGQLTSAFIDLGSARAHLKSFKVLAVTGTKRLPALPDVPTFAEQGFHSFEPYGWFAFFMPAGTPTAVVNKFSEETNRILALPDIVARVEGMSLWVGGEKPAEFAAAMKADAAVYAKIIKDGNIKLSQ